MLALTKSDRRRAGSLYRACMTMENEDVWVPLCSSCTTCHGYPFSTHTDIQLQLGACGCLIALEMEIACIPPSTKAAIIQCSGDSQASTGLLEALLKINAKQGNTPAAGMKYL